ncbi:MAG: hypothetical protein RID91_21995 [Azospirillaceae bacterium]
MARQTPSKGEHGASSAPGPAEHQGLKRAAGQRGKNLALLAVLVAFVVLVYIVAVVRMGGGG